MHSPDGRVPGRSAEAPGDTTAPGHAPAPGSPRERFRERLARGPVLVDGAMGTLLFSRGIPQRACLDELPTIRPDMIGTIHREYLEAGAEIIETATFGANRLRLAQY